MGNKALKIWYEDTGLRFGCTQCGKCCTGSPGYVWLLEEDIARLSEHLKLSREEFLQKYARAVEFRYSLKEHSDTFDCVFLKDNKCTVYDKRPKQCRVFPFWKEILSSKEAWDDSAKHCEGINHKDGKLFSYEEIQKMLNE